LVNNHSSHVYEGIVCDNVQNCSYVQGCINCSECHFCFDCIGCQFCYGCTSLRNKKYYFFNKSLSKEDYEKELEKMKTSSVSEIFSRFKAGKAFPATIIRNSSNCVGDNIINSKNVFY
jgi:hypothetical protein